MLDMDAMVLSVFRDRLRTGRKPPRDVVLAFVADEEAGGTFGASWLVDSHPELFEGCTEAISEVGGFSLSVSDDVRLYMIETAQKGMGWMRLTAEGTAGHGSMLTTDNAVTELCDAVARLGRHEFPMHLTKTVRRFLAEVSDAYGVELDPEDLDQVRSVLGPMARIVGATLRNTANPTMLDAGYKHNVIPSSASAMVDGRFLPGFEDDFERELDAVLGPRITREYMHYDIALETEFEGELVNAMVASLKAEDPGARPVPYALSGGTDAKSFSRLGIRGFGFAPLRLPADLDFSGMFHGVDERVPLDALQVRRAGAGPLPRRLLSGARDQPPLRSRAACRPPGGPDRRRVGATSAAAAGAAGPCGGRSPGGGRRTTGRAGPAPTRRTRRGSGAAPWSSPGRRPRGCSPRGTRTRPRRPRYRAAGRSRPGRVDRLAQQRGEAGPARPRAPPSRTARARAAPAAWTTDRWRWARVKAV